MAGRPRQFDREAALRTARDVFWARGFEATSMSDLVAALGIASARIYAAFGSKERLFKEAIELYEREEGAFSTQALSEQPTAYQAIERLLLDAVDLYTAQRVHWAAWWCRQPPTARPTTTLCANGWPTTAAKKPCRSFSACSRRPRRAS